MNNQENFSSEYIKESGTTKQVEAKSIDEQAVHFDTNKYGISKPRRVILRAKIKHDRE